MIGSSDVPVILGLPHPVSGRPKDVWPVYERVTGLRPRFDDSGETKASLRGKALEAALLFWDQDAHPDEIVVPNAADYVFEWRSARPDALRVPTGGGARHELLPWAKGVTEAKTDRELNRDYWGDPPHHPPVFHEAQVRWQMAVLAELGAPIEDGRLVVFHPMSETYLEYIIPRDERLERALVSKVWDWYEQHVLDDHLPAFTGKAGRTLARKYPADGVTAREGTPAELNLVATAQALRREKTEVDRKLTEVKGQLMASMQDTTDLLQPTTRRRLVRWRPTKARRKIDIDRLRAERPDIAAEFEITLAGTRPFKLEE